MTEPLLPPKKKDPQVRTPVPQVPPMPRSRAALGLTAAAAEGRFALQVCAACGTRQYPPRDACQRCLSTDLPWRDVVPAGALIAETVVRASPDLYFRTRLPWRTGTVRLEDGPSILCHVHGDCAVGDTVRLGLRLDRAGQGVVIALPQKATPDMQDDLQLRELGADPRHRRVLITDARAAEAPALAAALLKAGAASVMLGEAETWRPCPRRVALAGMEGVQLVPLDLTDERSVARLAGELGGKADILINNARFVRPGDAFTQDRSFLREAMEVGVHGLARLAQAFGPAMQARSADGTNSAAAWVNVLSVSALAADPSHAAVSATSAAALSLTQSLRAGMQASGVRVVTVLTGPTDDEWHQEVPPPKVAPGALARAVVDGLQQGLEEVVVGDVARDLVKRWRENPKVLERELAAGLHR